jgi:hypothetical protein
MGDIGSDRAAFSGNDITFSNGISWKIQGHCSNAANDANAGYIKRALH